MEPARGISFLNFSQTVGDRRKCHLIAFENTLAGCEVMPLAVSHTPCAKPQMGERRSNTLSVVVERLDHHCGDDLIKDDIQRLEITPTSA